MKAEGRIQKLLHSLVGLGTVSLCTMASPAAALSPHPMIYRVESIQQHLVGQMETVPHPERPQVRMTTCAIALQGLYGRYLYQEQALVNTLEQPYRQRILLLTPDESFQQVESRSFRIEEQADWAGLCDRPTVERETVLDALGEQVCSVLIERVDRTYVGNTPPEGCPANYRGAVRISNTVILHDTGMDTWDRGFDAEGNQVWGAADSAYEFRWIDPE